MDDGYVRVPRKDLELIRSMMTIEALAPAEHEFEREKRREAWAKIEAIIAELLSQPTP